MLDREMRKRQAAAEAVRMIRPGMRVGIGTGTTARHLVELLAEQVEAGLEVVATATSEETARHAAALGIPQRSLDDLGTLDLAIDGADAIAPDLSLVKGGGGAHFREKLVASAARTFVCIADDAKVVQRLGAFPVPVEVLPFGWRTTRSRISSMGAQCNLRLRGGEPWRTDNGNLLLDCDFGRIDDPGALAKCLDSVVGAVEHGLFVGICSLALIGQSDGSVVRLSPD